MQRVHLGELDVSRIVYGLMGLGGSWDVDDGVGEAEVRAKLEACLEVGITTLDHADIYTSYRGEAVLGQVFRADPAFRDRFEIATKCGIVAPLGDSVGIYSDQPVKHYDTSPVHIRSSVERSLRHIHTDRIDMLMIHRPDPFMDHEATGRVLDALVASGDVAHIGVSNFRPWDVSLLQSAMGAPIVTNQIELSLAHVEPFTNGDVAFCQEHGMRPMAWSPLGGGALMDEKTPVGGKLAEMAEAKGYGADQLALAWLLAHPVGVVPVVGTGKVERIKRAAGALDVEVSRVEWFALYEAALGRAVA